MVEWYILQLKWIKNRWKKNPVDLFIKIQTREKIILNTTYILCEPSQFSRK
jgi:hypothetical protein